MCIMYHYDDSYSGWGQTYEPHSSASWTLLFTGAYHYASLHTHTHIHTHTHTHRDIFAILGFELRASCLPSRRSGTWDTRQPMVLLCCPGWSGVLGLMCSSSWVPIGTYHHLFFVQY
jgi:hypothetical protein